MFKWCKLSNYTQSSLTFCACKLRWYLRLRDFSKLRNVGLVGNQTCSECRKCPRLGVFFLSFFHTILVIHLFFIHYFFCLLCLPVCYTFKKIIHAYTYIMLSFLQTGKHNGSKGSLLTQQVFIFQIFTAVGGSQRCGVWLEIHSNELWFKY